MTGPTPAGTHQGPDRDGQIKALIELVGTLAQNLRRLESKVNRAAKKAAEEARNDEDEDPAAPAPWVWFAPPAAAEDDPDGDDDPRCTVENFVGWFNATFVGLDGGRARPIPPCWRQHPGLALEVASLAYSWRAANIGPEASERDAQYWLHQWRPGFSDRLVREWASPDCLDGDHRDNGAPPRPDRFAAAEQHAAARANRPP